MVDNKQIIVVWYVDDLKISHEDPKAVTKSIQQLNTCYGKTPTSSITLLSVTRGKIHDYLGMKLDYSKDGKVAIDMTEYLEKVLEDLPDNFKKPAITSAAEHLFHIIKNAIKLETKDAELFHHVVAQLLFLSKRGRPDILTAITFLTTRVKSPDFDDMKKLKRATRYLQDTKNLALTLESENTGTIHWWVDAVFGVHHDMRSHTSGILSLEKGAIYSTSTK